jgi:signal transduction histidine kinase
MGARAAEVFISATTRELRSYREEVKNALLTFGVFLIEQANFRLVHGPANCEAARPHLHILRLEDDPNDVALVQSTLKLGGITCAVTCVQDRDEFVAALEYGGIDLVISDFTLPASVRARWPDMPIILVAGALGEELDIDSLKSGATEYLLKEHLFRFGPTVRRANEEVDQRVQRGRLEEQIVQAQARGRGVAQDVNNMLTVIIGNNELMMSEISPESPLAKYIEQIQRASDSAVGLTQQMLVFGRKRYLARW